MNKKVTQHLGGSTSAGNKSRASALERDGIALAKLVVKYFGDDEINELLNADIRLRNMARGLLARAEKAGKPVEPRRNS